MLGMKSPCARSAKFEVQSGEFSQSRPSLDPGSFRLFVDCLTNLGNASEIFHDWLLSGFLRFVCLSHYL